MKKRIFSVLTAFLVLFSMFPAYSAYAIDAEKAVSVWYINPAAETMEKADKVELYSGGEVNLSAKIKDGISGDIQWQIKGDNNTWFDIQDGTEKDLRVSYGMVQGLLKNDSVRMRCAVLGEEEYYSDAVKITVTEEDDRVTADSQDLDAAPVAPEPLPAPVATPIENKSTEEASVKEKQSAPVLMRSMAAPAAAAADEIAPVAEGDEGESEPPDETKTYCTIIIEYVYHESSQFAGQRVALPYIAEVESGDSLSAVVNSPNCVGYNPDIDKINLSTLGAITKNETYTVKYSPAEVSYTVRHYQQNVDDDEYTWVDTTMANGLTESRTKNEDAEQAFDGFTALEHYSEPIAADSSTMIDIYYDRNYYLLSFELDGGNGVNPVYARYEAEVSVGTPSKPGWQFAGWKDAPGDEGEFVSVPKKMPHENRTFYAAWEPIPDGTTYSVAYWVENSDGTKTYLTTKTETAAAGDIVSGSDDIREADVCGIKGHTHTSDCGLVCSIAEHTHTTTACFSNSIIRVGKEVSATSADMNVMKSVNGGNADTTGTYLYFIQAYNDPANGVYWPKLYVDGKYYSITVNWNESINKTVLDSIVGDYVGQGQYNANDTVYYAYKYEVKATSSTGQTILRCGFDTEHRHIDECYTCGKAEHVHSDSCKTELAQYLDFVRADENVTVSGDGTTVVNAYYKYRTYTIRYVYARERQGNYQIATLTNNGTLNGCQWTNVDDLPKFDDPSGEKTRSYFTDGNYRYYYISLTAKFGEDISESWPAANIEAVGGYEWGSWAAAYGTGYRQKYGDAHANIVGVYPTMSQDMIGQEQELLREENGTKVYLAQNMIAWWAGWNSGVEKHSYHNYFEVIGEPQDGDVQYKGKSYRLEETIVFTAAHNGSTRVDPIGYNGYTCINEDYKKQGDSTQFSNDGDCSICEGNSCNYCNTFYYDAIKYKLSFWNHNEWLTSYEDVEVAYGAALAGYESGATELAQANYPSALEAGVYVFDGWYTTKECYEDTRVDWTNLKMPASNLIIYAKWKPITHEVKFFKTEGGEQLQNSPIDVTHGQLVPADKRPDETQLKHPSDKDATFIGWFYKDASGDEQAFDFANMAIMQDMSIYAKWRSNVMKEVVIDYVFENEDGNKTKVAASESVMMRLGQTRTFEAKVGTSMYQEYREGYFPETQTHSETIDEDDIKKNEPKRYTFVYNKSSQVPYQVTFSIIENGVERPAFRETENGKAEFVEYGQWNESYTGYVERHENNKKAIVTELYIPDDLAVQTWTLPDEYLPNALKLQKVIIPSENDPENNIAANTIKFVYTYTEPEDPDNPVYKARYLIQHFVQDPVNTDEYMLYSYKDESGDSGDTVKASPISIPGYTYDYEVTNANKKTGTELNEATREMTGVIDADDSLELNFYYKANPYPYKVMYLEEGTNQVLTKEKTHGTDGKQLTGLYGSRVTESAIDIEGYDVVGSAEKSIYIQMEAGDKANVNTIVFYYKQKSAKLSISKNVVLDPDQAAQEGISKIPDWVYDQDFEFTVFKKEGFPKSRYEFTVTDAAGNKENRTVDADYQTITISLKPGETALIPGLPMGKYDVTETYVPGFVSTVDGYIAQKHSVTMNNDGETGTLNFVNRFPFYTGDLVIKKVVKKQDPSDPEATAPYKVSVVLKPQDVAREVDRVITFVDQDGNAVTDANRNSSLTIPKLAQIDEENPSGDTFTIDVLVPVGGEVKLQGVPVGTFIATEEAKTEGYISDYYMVKYNKALHKNDEVIGSGHEISGEIHGGHPTSITYNNTYKKGNLTINKTVMQEYVNDSWNGDTFIFEIEGTTELPDGTYNIEADGKTSTVVVEDGKVTFNDEISISKTAGETSWSSSLSYKNLPAGYYTVTEIKSKEHELSEYKVEPPAPKQLVNKTNPGEEVEFSFTNTFKRTTGSLQVGKEIRIVTAGATIDEEQYFTFVVQPKDGELTGSYNCTVKTTNGTANTDDDTVVTGSAAYLSVSDEKLTFKLKHNQYILIEGLPVGEYLVKEAFVEGYDSSFSNTDGNYSVESATITTRNTTSLDCKNEYPVYYGNVIVKKKVLSPSENPNDIDKAPEDDVFTFTASFSNYSDKVNLNGVIRAEFYTKDTTEKRNLVITDDTITFDLKANEWVDLNLPAGDYTIEETGLSSTVNTTGNLADHYTTSFTVGDEKGVDGNTYELISGECETVEFTNKYKEHYLDLTITTPEYAYADQSFIFTVSGTPVDTARFGSNITQKVVLVGEDSQTIKDLPIGDYTVTEQTEWSWREDPVNSQTVELRTSNVTVPFKFDVLDRIFWLSDYSYNFQKKGGN